VDSFSALATTVKDSWALVACKTRTIGEWESECQTGNAARLPKLAILKAAAHPAEHMMLPIHQLLAHC